MRIALAFVLFAGCIQPAQPDPGPAPDPGGWGTGTGGTGGQTSTWCHADSECGSVGDVCARDGECLPSSSVRTVHVTWTLRGAVADTTSCASVPDLEISFIVSGGTGDQFGFAPVPCVEGKFTIDKLPTRYDEVQLGNAADLTRAAEGLFASDGTVSLDLLY